jgi:hypothetical protein
MSLLPFLKQSHVPHSTSPVYKAMRDTQNFVHSDQTYSFVQSTFPLLSQMGSLSFSTLQHTFLFTIHPLLFRDRAIILIRTELNWALRTEPTE